MELRHGLISVDDQVQEHPRVWTDRMSASRWGDRIPHVERLSDGTDRWVIDGQPAGADGVASAGALLADRASTPGTWQDVPAAAYLAEERLRAMDADGVDYSVLYPTVAGEAGDVFGQLNDPELELACVRAYNDFLIEEWSTKNNRFIPQCIVPISPVEATVAEIRRAVGQGHRGVIYPAIPMHLRDVPHVNDDAYDPVWDVCQSLGVPICLHAGSSPKTRLPLHPKVSARLTGAIEAMTGPASGVFDVTNVLFSRILQRFPQLKVVFAGSTLGWATFLLEYADHQFEQDHCEGYDLKPSEMFRRQCLFTGWYDSVAPQIPFVGATSMMWATKFPATTSTWPETRAVIGRCFEGVGEADRAQVLWKNAADLYRL